MISYAPGHAVSADISFHCTVDMRMPFSQIPRAANASRVDASFRFRSHHQEAGQLRGPFHECTRVNFILLVDCCFWHCIGNITTNASNIISTIYNIYECSLSFIAS